MVIQEMLQLSIELKMNLDLFGTFRPAYPLSQLPETDRILLFYIYIVKYTSLLYFQIYVCGSIVGAKVNQRYNQPR